MGEIVVCNRWSNLTREKLLELLYWTWSKTGVPRLKTIAQAPGQLLLTVDYGIEKTPIPRIEITQDYCILGVGISPSSCNKLAKTILSCQSQDFAGKIASSNLDREATYWAFWQFYIPKIGPPTSTNSQQSGM
jgi:hypothetical protein